MSKAIVLHPPESVTVTEYIPMQRLFIEELELPFDQLYEYGEAPAITLAVALPLHKLLHVTFVLVKAIETGKATVTFVDLLEEQPEPFVTVNV